MGRGEPDLEYAHVARERRFLLTGAPPDWSRVPERRIHDRSIRGTRLRLRAVEGGTARIE